MVNFQLTTEQLALQAKARKFALEEVLPVSQQYDQTGDFPRGIAGMQ